MGASGKKGMVHSGRERHAAQGKENDSGKGVHATTLETCELEVYTGSSIWGGGGKKSRQGHHLPMSGVKDIIFPLTK